MEKPIAGYGFFIKRIDNALEKEANANLHALNLTAQQNRVLIQLAHAEGNTLPLKALEEHFGAAQSTVAGLVSRLEKKGLVAAAPSPTDRRIKLVRLTEEGRRIHELGHEDVVRSEERLTATLTETEKAVLLTALQKVWAAISESQENQKG